VTSRTPPLQVSSLTADELENATIKVA